MWQAELESELELSKQRLTLLEEKLPEPVDVEQVGDDTQKNIKVASAPSYHTIHQCG